MLGAYRILAIDPSWIGKTEKYIDCASIHNCSKYHERAFLAGHSIRATKHDLASF